MFSERLRKLEEMVRKLEEQRPVTVRTLTPSARRRRAARVMHPADELRPGALKVELRKITPGEVNRMVKLAAFTRFIPGKQFSGRRRGVARGWWIQFDTPRTIAFIGQYKGVLVIHFFKRGGRGKVLRYAFTYRQPGGLSLKNAKPGITPEDVAEKFRLRSLFGPPVFTPQAWEGVAKKKDPRNDFLALVRTSLSHIADQILARQQKRFVQRYIGSTMDFVVDEALADWSDILALAGGKLPESEAARLEEFLLEFDVPGRDVELLTD